MRRRDHAKPARQQEDTGRDHAGNRHDEKNKQRQRNTQRTDMPVWLFHVVFTAL